MSPRDVLVVRPLAALLVVIAIAAVGQACLPELRDELPLTLAWWSGLALATHLIRLGYGAVVTPSLAIATTAGMAYTTVVGGGPWSLPATGIPLVVAILWAWSGRWAAAGAAATLTGALVVGAVWFPDAPPRPVEQYLGQHLVLIVEATLFVGVVVQELEKASVAAWQRTREAEAAALEAEGAREARERFLASISREMRTPLHGILGYSELLIEDEADPERLTDLRRVNAAGAHLLRLLDDLLDLSRAQAEGLRFERAVIDLRELIDEVVSTTQPLAAAHGNVVRVDLPPGSPAILGDRGRVHQILLNLISNANKYTNRGAVDIIVRAASGAVGIEVRDEGMGIPAGKMSSLFQPFTQLHEGTERRPGIGLGLALSQELARRMHGEISARSTEGVGSTFTLLLPEAPSSPP